MAIEDGYAICFNQWALDNEIKNELGLLLIISGLTAEKGYCFVKKEYLANIFDISAKTMDRKIKRLEKLGYITAINKNYTDEQAFEKLNIKNSEKGCLFCGYNEYVLDKHHYPIRFKDGGTETITLCPNCHRAFHCLTGDYETTLLISLREPYSTKLTDIIKEVSNGKS